MVLPLNDPREALGHRFTYVGHSPLPDGKTGFNVQVENGKTRYQLTPVMFDAGEQGVMRNPDIASFLTRDIYLSPINLEQGSHDETENDVHTLAKGETVSVGDVDVTFARFDMDQHGGASAPPGGGMVIGSVLELQRVEEREMITPVMVYRPDGTTQYRNADSELLNTGVQLLSMNVGTGGAPSTITVGIQRGGDGAHQHESLVLEASIKPFINFLWVGTALMMIGFFLAILKRSKEA